MLSLLAAYGWMLMHEMGAFESHWNDFCCMALYPYEYLILHVYLCTCSYQPPVLKYQVIPFKEDKADTKQVVKAYGVGWVTGADW